MLCQYSPGISQACRTRAVFFVYNWDVALALDLSSRNLKNRHYNGDGNHHQHHK